MSAVRYQNPLLRFTEEIEGLLLLPVQTKNIVIDHNVNGILERILVAHELGHAVLHTKIAMMHGFQEMEVLMIDQSKKMKQTSLRRSFC